MKAGFALQLAMFSSVTRSLVASRDFEERWIRFGSRDLIYRHRFAAAAGVVLDEEIDAQICGVPILIRNNDIFAALAGDGLRLPDSVS